MVDFNTPYKSSLLTEGRYEVVLGGEKLEEVKEFKY